MTITTDPRATQPTTWHFVLHGGFAGQITEALGKGATAREAVALAVSASEDCVAFNAGHGAALNENGAIVLDSYGQLAVGGSPGGGTGKMDTAICRAGLYADDRISVLCGAGDEILKHSVAHTVTRLYAAGHSLRDAARQAVDPISHASGESVVESNARHFPIAWGSSSTSPKILIHPTTVPVLPTLQFFEDSHMVIGNSRYPSSRGHTVAALKLGASNLFALPLDDFLHGMNVLHASCSAWRVLQGLTLRADHRNDVKEFHRTFPGCVASHDGPMMASARLDEICHKIQSVSGLSPPFDSRFDGPDDDGNIFARIIRGQLPQWRIWEGEDHVAFLTPFSNAEGFTVLVPRPPLSSDIFAIEPLSYAKLMKAAHKIAGFLTRAFGIHRDASLEAVESFQETYQGYVSSLSGPITQEFPALGRAAQALRRLMPTDISNGLSNSTILRAPKESEYGH
ncbi:HIT-like protein [Aspergillus terreus]|uniref:HIT-like protein n=1 Tax=Aspergillus terreus TaxID=33178 RepID=A0A5M3YT31_ASPTE|nr:hypothetical protein ATETN484_0003071100 [Aspergillus terreus]GFF14697.1 HIT-like protein [Aspergillus terreus]